MRVMWLISSVLIAAILLPVATAQPTPEKKDEEPPLLMELKIKDGEGIPVQTDKPFTVKIGDKTYEMTLTKLPFRQFDAEGIRFQYPADYRFEVDHPIPGRLSRWMFESTTYKSNMMGVYKYHTLKATAEEVYKDILKTFKYTGFTNIEKFPARIKLGRRRLKGVKYTGNLGTERVSIELFGFHLRGVMHLFLLQDSGDTKGRRSKEMAEVLALLDRTFEAPEDVETEPAPAGETTQTADDEPSPTEERLQAAQDEAFWIWLVASLLIAAMLVFGIRSMNPERHAVPGSTLGMPPGSVRAMVALALLGTALTVLIDFDRDVSAALGLVTALALGACLTTRVPRHRLMLPPAAFAWLVFLGAAGVGSFLAWRWHVLNLDFFVQDGFVPLSALLMFFVGRLEARVMERWGGFRNMPRYSGLQAASCLAALIGLVVIILFDHRFVFDGHVHAALLAMMAYYFGTR